MTECDQVEHMSMQMSLMLDGLLDAPDERHLQGHLATCPACQVEWEVMQEVSASLAGVAMVGPPLGFAIRVERRLEEREKRRQRTFGGVALLTGSLSLAGVTIAALAMVVFGVVAWQSLGTESVVQQGAGTVVQIASGMGLVGKAASFFLKDLLVRYGLPLALTLAASLGLLTGVWAWLFVKRPGSARHNGVV